MTDQHFSTPVPSGKLMLAAPQVEDALRSCAGLLASRTGSIVLCLFGSLAESASRRAQQLQALQSLQTEGLQTDLPDLPPRQRNLSGLAAALRRALLAHQPDCFLLPCGLGLPPQRQIHHAGLLLASSFPGLQWQLYDDMTQPHIEQALAQRLRYLALAGIEATPWTFDVKQNLAGKRAALAILGRDAGDVPERYWRLQWRKET